MQEAEAAEARIKEGLSFAALAAERGLKEQDFDLGTCRKSGHPRSGRCQRRLRAQGRRSERAGQGRFGAAIVTVTKIEPEEDKIARRRDAADPQGDRRRTRQGRRTAPPRQDRGRARRRRIVPQIGGKAEAAGRHLRCRSSPAANRTARSPISPHAGQVIKAAFDTEVGRRQRSARGRRRLRLVQCRGITPSRDRTLDEVKDQVEARWREDEIATRLKTKSAELLDKLKAGKAFDAVATVRRAHSPKGRQDSSAASRKPASRASMAVRSFARPRTPSAAPKATSRPSGSSFASPISARRNSKPNSPEMKRIAESVRSRTTDEVILERISGLARE